MRILILAALAAGALISTTAADAAVLHYTASLDGASETPPNTTTGTGAVKLDLDTDAKTVSWMVTYQGLTGPATAAHFHGPAPVGRPAGVEIPVKGDLTSPITGQATITDTQMDDLRAGQWYFNIHTAAHPAGEVRGQVLPAR
jgi:hypothetical protein